MRVSSKKIKKISKDLDYKADLIQQLNAISMLNEESLRVLYYLGSKSKTILEFGPYIGGSTIAIAKGNKFSIFKKFLFNTIELGGANVEHAHLPSHNILEDLNTNLSKFQVAGKVNIIQGLSANWNSVQMCESLLNGRKFDMVLMDSDGFIEENIAAYKKFFKKEVYLILDDFERVENEDPFSKANNVNKWVQTNLKNGRLTEHAILKWSTWFGKYRK
jgi:predicted O-methyltransferase YrrM